MASAGISISSPELRRLADPETHEFKTPVKKINDGDDLAFFFVSKAYRDLMQWLLQLNRAVFPASRSDGQALTHTLDSSPQYSTRLESVRSLLLDLSNLIEKAPPDTGARRFGNVAFRTWYQLAEEDSARLIREHLGEALSTASPGVLTDSLVDELKAYLVGAFGSSQRLDYGTGHELSFLAFLAGLWKLNFFDRGDECAIVIGVVQPYIELVRKLIMTYTLEPAGSHGVWGLDDHSFVPYIFGSAQLGPAIRANDYSSPVPTEGSLPSAPPPSSVTDKTMVSEYKDSNMYFSAIQFIYDVKKGPFWEHSPVLYDISGIKDGWGKINKGMLKMYAAEVLGKFPVVQHFPLGSLFEWERDPDVARPLSSVHSQQQPAAMQSKDMPPVNSGGTAAPWSRLGRSTVPQMQANTGTPSTRAPWATNTANGRVSGAATSDMRSHRRPPDMASTAAPWARKNPES